MMIQTLAEIREYIEDKLKPDRFRHSIGVMETARELAVRYGEDPDRAQLAGILHDCGRQFGHEESLRLMDALGYIPNEVERFSPSLLHGRIGALLARERFSIEDDAILSAIACHTTGKVGMSLLDKIIYVADYIEPNRDGDWVYPMRTMAFRDLDGCLVMCADSTLTFEMKKGNPIHPDTLRMRNSVLMAAKGIKHDG